MKVVFDDRYRIVYDTDPAAAPGRIDCIVDELKGLYEFVKPRPAAESDILLVHSKDHLEHIKNRELLYDIALLAAGGAIKAAELAVQGEPAFALIRPPGHHASRDSCWGFCWFNNIAIAVEKLRTQGLVKKVLIVDIDLHFGDGTNNIFEKNPDVFYYHLYNLKGLEQCLSVNTDCELVAVSAGFDMHVQDWGCVLSTEDYTTIGRMISGHARKVCNGRFFAVLEGGYNHRVLGKNVRALLQGFEG
ncbi:MAG: histone deacetylase family protein [Pelotomaculum sp.]|uniref:Deacetylases n=1 Tax=Pelotomaculum thermopropionicum (strain DSM 13744 / JCM 10971 / SI) TaxID=370438 RepID=A5D3S4_PELTS|nr:histone deacetylase family protein [Pelotomaculum sp.]BAF59097.1 deacetylases [Pelotomaculum thermopropionicum SI]